MTIVGDEGASRSTETPPSRSSSAITVARLIGASSTGGSSSTVGSSSSTGGSSSALSSGVGSSVPTSNTNGSLALTCAKQGTTPTSASDSRACAKKLASVRPFAASASSSASISARVNGDGRSSACSRSGLAETSTSTPAPPTARSESFAAVTIVAERKGSSSSTAWRHSITNATGPGTRSRITVAMSRTESPVSGFSGSRQRKSSPSALATTRADA